MPIALKTQHFDYILSEERDDESATTFSCRTLNGLEVSECYSGGDVDWVKAVQYGLVDWDLKDEEGKDFPLKKIGNKLVSPKSLQVLSMSHIVELGVEIIKRSNPEVEDLGK